MGIIKDSTTEVTYNVTLDQLKSLLSTDLGVAESAVKITAKMVTRMDAMDRESWQEFNGLTVVVSGNPSPPAPTEQAQVPYPLLTYNNNWESDEYWVAKLRVTKLKKVRINDVYYQVTGKTVSVPYSDMGHSYSGTSTHFFIEVGDINLKTTVDLNTIVDEQKVYAVEYNKTKK